MPSGKGIYFIRSVSAIAPPHLYLRGHKVTRIPYGTDKSFQIDLEQIRIITGFESFRPRCTEAFDRPYVTF
jgi:hypothetical protein